MNIAYVDSSFLIAIACSQAGYRDVMVRLARFDQRFSSSLLEAEFRAVLAREQVSGRGGNLLSWIDLFHPRSRLTREIDRVLEVHTPRGSDLWHLANALYLRRKVRDLAFLTLDRQQKNIAQALGFRDR